MVTSNITLKQALISEVNSLKGIAISKKTLIEKLAQKYPQFSKTYIQMYIRKCIINNPYRAKWGRAIDLFAQTANGFLISSKKYLENFQVVEEDKEHAKARKTARKVEMAEILEAYEKGATFAL
jgi:hypothetical protein